MRVKVTSTDTGWRPSPSADWLYTIHVEGQSEPQKTWDKDLAVVGEHDAEQYQTKTGKTYWRLVKDKPKSAFPQKKVFATDDQTRDSIEKQKALAEAVQFHLTLISTDDEVLATAYKFLNWLTSPYDPSQVSIKRESSFAMVNPDLPPTELYENLS